MARPRPEVNAAFGSVLRVERTRAGLTQEALAERCDVHPSYISQMERGVKSPSLAMLANLADALGTEVSSLVRDAEESLRPGGS